LPYRGIDRIVSTSSPPLHIRGINEENIRGGEKTVHVVCPEARKRWVAGGVTPSPLSTTQFASLSVDISFKDDVTVILRLDINRRAFSKNSPLLLSLPPPLLCPSIHSPSPISLLLTPLLSSYTPFNDTFSLPLI
jgi:hypothetical protein